MNCAEIEKLIYTFREADAREQAEVQRHVETCENCHKLFSEMERVFELTAKLRSKKQGPIINYHFQS